jgi:outer membrane protein, heavy metal efflux system
MAGRSVAFRIGIRTLAGFLLLLWFGTAIGCRTRSDFQQAPASPVTSLPPVAPAPRDAVEPQGAPSPQPAKPEPPPAAQDAASPAAPASYQETIPPGLPQLPQELTLEEVLERTLQNHPALRARNEEVQAARARLITAGLKPNPQFVLNADSETSADHAVNLNSRVEFTLERAGKRQFRQSAASAQIARAQCELKAETERILVDAADAAWEVVYLQELLDLEGKLQEMLVKTAEVQRSRPDATYADRVEADTDAAELELARLEARSTLEIARLKLSQAIGLDCPEALHMRGELAVHRVIELPIDDFLCRVRQCRPQLGSAQAAVTESEYLHRLECAKAKPDIGLGPRFREGFEDGVDRLGLRFSTDLPVFNRNQGRIQESAAEMRKQAELCRGVRITTLTDTAAAYKELLELQSRLQYYQAEIIPLAKRTETTIHEAFAARQIRAEQMSDLQRNFVRLRLKELALRYRFNQLSTRLRLFLGESFVVP